MNPSQNHGTYRPIDGEEARQGCDAESKKFLQLEGNSTVKINGNVIKSAYASMIRSGEIKSIDIVLDTKELEV